MDEFKEPQLKRKGPTFNVEEIFPHNLYLTEVYAPFIPPIDAEFTIGTKVKGGSPKDTKKNTSHTIPFTDTESNEFASCVVDTDKYFTPEEKKNFFCKPNSVFDIPEEKDDREYPLYHPTLEIMSGGNNKILFDTEERTSKNTRLMFHSDIGFIIISSVAQSGKVMVEKHWSRIENVVTEFLEEFSNIKQPTKIQINVLSLLQLLTKHGEERYDSFVKIWERVTEHYTTSIDKVASFLEHYKDLSFVGKKHPWLIELETINVKNHQITEDELLQPQVKSIGMDTYPKEDTKKPKFQYTENQKVLTQDIDLVMLQCTGITREQAEEALTTKCGDIVEAIMSLTLN